VLRLDQHAVEEHRVVRRDPEVARGHVDIEHASLDANRQNVSPPQDEAAAVAAPSDPLDRPQRARRGHDFVADRKLLDSSRAFSSFDQRARAIAGDDVVLAAVVEPLATCTRRFDDGRPGISSVTVSGVVPESSVPWSTSVLLK
jgi:hypothetical protein